MEVFWQELFPVFVSAVAGRHSEERVSSLNAFGVGAGATRQEPWYSSPTSAGRSTGLGHRAEVKFDS